MSLLYTILSQRSQPNLSAASKTQRVDRASNMFRPSVSANEFQLALVNGGDDGDDKFDVVVPSHTEAEDAITRDVSVPKVAVKGGSRTNTGRPLQPDSDKPSFQVDAFEALRMQESGITLPTTGNNRQERTDRNEKKREKTAKNARPQRNKKAATNNRVNAKEGGLPQVAWIMSFGGSVSETH
jgi:hypothetical protein